jgi:hypothetical protein
MQRLVLTSFSHLLNSDTVRVEITTGRENKIGRGSHILIHLYSQVGRSPFTPHVAATLALQLEVLIAHRPDDDSFTGLQWDPLMSLIPGYPFLCDSHTQQCELDRVTWMIPELTTGSVSPASSQTTAIRPPRYNLPGTRAYTVSQLQVRRNCFLSHIFRLFTRDPVGPTLSPPNIVLLANAQSLRNQKA